MHWGAYCASRAEAACRGTADLTAGGLIALTERGRALMPALDLIAQWARDHLPPDKC